MPVRERKHGADIWASSSTSRYAFLETDFFWPQNFLATEGTEITEI
jgi:hypothetical protein